MEPYMKVKRFIVDGAKRPVVEIIDAYNCIYCPLSSLYLTTHEELSHNTLMRVAYELRFFLKWLCSRGINIIDRTKSGKFLTDIELNEFCRFSRYKVGFTSYHLIPAQPTNKYFSNVMHESSYLEYSVSPNVTNGRLHRASEYLLFLHRELNWLSMNGCSTHVIDRNQMLFQEGKRKEFTCGQDSKNHSFGRTIPNNIMEKMFSILHLNSQSNPFIRLVRIRNSLVVDLLVDTGIRRGALAKLKISDVYFQGSIQKILISRSPQDKTDVRPNKPEQKTQEHFSYPDSRTMQKLKTYIEQYRPLIPGSEKHEFVFVTEKNGRNTQGHPMSVDTINYIFNKLSKVLDTRIYPHLLRHCWNERFSDLQNSKDLTTVEIDKYRRILMGWSPTSVMPSQYNKIRDVEKAQELARSMQRELIGGNDGPIY